MSPIPKMLKYSPRAIVNRIRLEKRPVRFLIARFLWRTGLGRAFRIDNGKFRMRFFPTALSASLWYDVNARSEDERFLCGYLKPGDTVIDVGANIGNLTLAAAHTVGSRGRVVSVEAHPTTFDYLRSNVNSNRFTWIELVNCALGSENGFVFFSNKYLDDQNEVVPDPSNGRRVELRTLDSVAPRVATVALLKIDVEGFEKFVLQGAVDTLAKTQCVFFEAWDKHAAKYGYLTGDLIQLLNASGLEVYRMHGKELVAVDSRYRAEVLENLLAIRDPTDFLGRCPNYRFPES